VDQLVSRDPDMVGRNEDRQTAYWLRCEYRTSGRRSGAPSFAVSELNLLSRFVAANGLKILSACLVMILLPYMRKLPK
jgi:hypothetical protein